MRTYIFTALERKALDQWLNGQLTLKDMRVQRTLSRIRLFNNLIDDVDLFIKVRGRLAEPKTA